MKHLLFLSFFWIGVNSNAQNVVTFKVANIPVEAVNVGIRGNISPLSWDKSIVLKKKGDVYETELEFSANDEELEYKFVIFEKDTDVTWENTSNRSLKLPSNKENVIEIGKWNQEQVLDISKLEKIESSLLLEDYKLIEELVLKVHPGTYRYNSKEEVNQALKNLKERFSQALTHQEAYLEVSKMMASLQCDHTKAGFNNQTKIINSIIHYQNDKFPFTFQWLGEEMIINLNASNSEFLERGTKVFYINDTPVSAIKERMMPYIGADGATDKNRVYKMQVNGYDFRYNAFDVFYPLLYPITNQKLKLIIQRPGSKSIENIVVNTLSREERFEVLSSRYPDFSKTRDDMWKFEILPDNIAMLTLNSFGLFGWKKMTIDYKAFLADAFQQMENQQITDLIIDIRENNGGNDEMANELFSYLAEETPDYNREGRTRYTSFPEELKPHIKTWGDNPWFYELKPKKKKPDNGYYIFKEKSKRTKSDKSIFKGKVYLLTSSANTSLAFYTALRFKKQQLGLIIGDETGGNLNDVNGGQIIFLTLPNSQIEIDSPVMGGFTVEPQANTGVMPDIFVEYQLEDIVEQRDIELQKVLALIRSK